MIPAFDDIPPPTRWRAARAAASSLVAAAALLLPVLTVSGQRSVAPVVALQGVTVIDVRAGGRLADATVLIGGGRILSVTTGKGVPAPRGARVIDGRGKFVIPGLWDMHVEEALPIWDRAPLDSNAAFFHPMFLAHGVTGVRDVAGASTVLARWRRQIEQGERIGPRIVFTGPKLGSEAVGEGAPFPVTDKADLTRSLEVLKRDGASATYVLSIPSALYPALAAESKRIGVPFEGLVPFTTSLREVAVAGQRAVDHLDGVLLGSSRDEARVREKLRTNEEKPFWTRMAWKLRLSKPLPYPAAFVLESWSQAHAESLFVHLARHRTAQIPTLRFLASLSRTGDSAIRLPPAPLELRPPRTSWNGWASAPYPPTHPLSRVYDRLRWSVGAMHRAGVPILAGSDTPNLYAAPGISLHDELALLVRAGLSPLAALRAATLAPAEYLGASDSLGTVSTGRVADLVVLDADPLLDIANTRKISMVVSRGVVYDRAALDAMIAAATRMANEVERYWIDRQRESQ